MENKNLKRGLEDMNRIQKEMRQTVETYFMTGGYEHQLNLLNTAIQDIVYKGASEDNNSLDNEFDYTNRYIRESIYELTELQKFLITLRESHIRYKRCCNYITQNATILDKAEGIHITANAK